MQVEKNMFVYYIQLLNISQQRDKVIYFDVVASDNEIFYTYGFIALAKNLHAMHFLC